MAKQKHGQSARRNNHLDKNQCTTTARRSIIYPSSSLLSILATIATTSQTVNGNPLPLPTPPPSFLCPSIEPSHALHVLALASPTSISSTSDFHPTSTSSFASSSTKSSQIRQVADKYVQGYDGHWHKVDEWTLYGSTWLASNLVVDTAAASSPTNSINSDQLDSVLPVGWNTSSQSTNRTGSIIILSLAIVLAVSICVFIIGCIVWRKRRKKLSNKEKKENDLELKTRHKAHLDDPSEDGEREKEIRGKLRVWAKASARWKAHIRHSARRRRNRRHAPSSGKLSRPQSPMLTDARDLSTPPLSPSSSRRHSIPSILEDHHFYAAATHPPDNSLTSTQTLSTSPTSSIPPIVSSPPAYILPAPQLRPINEDCLQEASHITLGATISRRESLLFSSEDDGIPYHPSYAGHVAIDDKAHLARIADLASAPPVNDDNINESFSATHESAPEWYDDFGDLDFHLNAHATSVPSSCEGGISGFPVPPSKGVFSSRYFEGHSYLEEITALNPNSLPSMPPYEAGPSVLPFEEILQASAPPLSDDDQPWESSTLGAPECDTHIPSHSSRHLFSPQLSAFGSPSPDQARDGVLPIYQP